VGSYVAYALRAWLVGEHAVSLWTSRFANWSAMLSFALEPLRKVTAQLGKTLLRQRPVHIIEIDP